MLRPTDVVWSKVKLDVVDMVVVSQRSSCGIQERHQDVVNEQCDVISGVGKITVELKILQEYILPGEVFHNKWDSGIL